MERIEYFDNFDKSEWGDGPWQTEPDKIQWLDEATLLPCLIVRNSLGNLCGYVGVTKKHPLHGIGYSDPINNGWIARIHRWLAAQNGLWRDPDHSWNEPRPDYALNAHGGITYANPCTEITEEGWLRMRSRLPQWEKEASRYPTGDAAQAFQTWKPVEHDFLAWEKMQEARGICHKPSPGEPDSVWWFGFDCAHSGDLVPAMTKYMERNRDWETYRDVAYVQEECEALAQQLKNYGDQ